MNGNEQCDLTKTECLHKDGVKLPKGGDDVTNSGPNGESEAAPPGVPRWVKVSAAIVVVLVVVLVLVMALAGGGHGPGLHTGVGTVAPSVGSQ